jgi:hypothetical protein
MITNETEIRVALQALLVGVLALYGFWGCALVVVFILLPWKPLLSVGVYLAQPLVDWRFRKAQERQQKGREQIARELDAVLEPGRGKVLAPPPEPKVKELVRPPVPHFPPALEMPEAVPVPAPTARETASKERERTSAVAGPRAALEAFRADSGPVPTPKSLTVSGQNLSATLAIPPVIQDHVRNLPQGVFSNMDLEVEQVKFQGDKAEAYVKFQSPSVRELVIHQRYVLRKSGNDWQVESRQPSNGTIRIPQHSRPVVPQTLRVS